MEQEYSLEAQELYSIILNKSIKENLNAQDIEDINTSINKFKQTGINKENINFVMKLLHVMFELKNDDKFKSIEEVEGILITNLYYI